MTETPYEVTLAVRAASDDKCKPSQCAFPFTYYDVTYNSCTDIGEGGKGTYEYRWCSTNETYTPGSGNFIKCTGCEDLPVYRAKTGDGKADFSKAGMTIPKVGTYQLQASISASYQGKKITIMSQSFAVVAGTPSSMRWARKPQQGTGGDVFAESFVAEVLDKGGNVVSGFTGKASLVVRSAPDGGSMRRLFDSATEGGLDVTVTNGAATWPMVFADKAGKYVVQAKAVAEVAAGQAASGGCPLLTHDPRLAQYGRRRDFAPNALPGT